MPFIGKDWRAPGETWVRVSHTAGWEQIKLRPIQLNACPAFEACVSASPPNKSFLVSSNSIVPLNDERNSMDRSISIHRHSSCSISSLSSTDDPTASANNNNNRLAIQPDSDEADEEDVEWIPHCFVKTTRSKEFIGCTSMSEAFHRLDLARAVVDIRRFNYICKVVQILVHEKLQNISATARKHLFAIIQSIVLHSVEQDVHVTTARDLLNQFSTGIEEGHVCGSPKLVSRQLDSVIGLQDLLLLDRKPTTLSDSSEDSMTFLDLPREVLSQILRRLPDHVSLLETAKAHETLEALVERETRLWRSLCEFHFTQEQINKHRLSEMSWRQVFFQLKKYFGLREIYADLIHICCHCKALFWKDHGHPCVSKETAPSVRVTPRQFVDMLLFL